MIDAYTWEKMGHVEWKVEEALSKERSGIDSDGKVACRQGEKNVTHRKGKGRVH